MSTLSLFCLFAVAATVGGVAAWLEFRMQRMKRAEHRARLVAAFDRVQGSLARTVVACEAAQDGLGKAAAGMGKAADALDLASARAEGRIH